MSTVKETAINSTKFWKECYDMGLKSEKLLRLLPLKIRNCEGSFEHSYGSVYMLSLHGEEAFDIAFDAGVVFDTKFTFTGRFSVTAAVEDSTDFMVMGVFPEGYLTRMYAISDEITIRVRVSDLPKPETCQIVEIKEEVTRFIAQCNETGDRV